MPGTRAEDAARLYEVCHSSERGTSAQIIVTRNGIDKVSYTIIDANDECRCVGMAESIARASVFLCGPAVSAIT
jgi:hypothetical protein